jgi:predicted adenylyl cyclase CyaB
MTTEPTIECEVRAMIDVEKFNELLAQFKETFSYLGADEQETHYLSGEQDLRIQKNEHYAKVWLKKGKLHDDFREEIEVQVPKEDFVKLEQLFAALGHTVTIKWFRTRHAFKWGDIDVALDYTRGYSYIIELEKLSTREQQDVTVAMLKDKLASLGIEQTPKEQFADKYRYYKDNWESLTSI